MDTIEKFKELSAYPDSIKPITDKLNLLRDVLIEAEKIYEIPAYSIDRVPELLFFTEEQPDLDRTRYDVLLRSSKPNTLNTHIKVTHLGYTFEGNFYLTIDDNFLSHLVDHFNFNFKRLDNK